MLTYYFCFYPFTAQGEIAESAEKETDTDSTDSSLSDDSDGDPEQDNENAGAPDDLILKYLDEWE